MKRYLLPSALILALGLGIAVAQNITSSVQLSQDPRGPIGLDSANNVYFPAHILTNQLPAPTVTAGAGTVTLVGTDNAGTITGGGVTTSTATMLFAKAYAAAPSCVLVGQTSQATSPIAYNIVPTAVNITTNVGAMIVNYWCSGAK